MPVNLQRIGITGRRAVLPGITRNLIASLSNLDTAPIENAPAQEAERVAPIDLQTESGSQETESGIKESVGRVNPDVARRNLQSISVPTALNYGLGLVSSIATGNPAPLIAAATRHGIGKVASDVVGPYIKKNIVNPVARAIGLGEGEPTGIGARGGSFGKDLSGRDIDPQTGLSEMETARSGSIGADIAGIGGYSPQDIAEYEGHSGGFDETTGFGGFDEDEGYF